MLLSTLAECVVVFLHMIALLAWFGLLCGLGAVYFAGVGFVALFLIYEQRIVSPMDTSRVNAAFFTMNGVIAVVFATFTSLDTVLG